MKSSEQIDKQVSKLDYIRRTTLRLQRGYSKREWAFYISGQIDFLSASKNENHLPSFNDRHLDPVYRNMAEETVRWLASPLDWDLRDYWLEKVGELDMKEYVIVRTYSAGCFAGYLIRREGKEVELERARRLWYWTGAATLSELAVRGTRTPDTCQFPEPVNRIVLTESIEIISCTEEARMSIEAVMPWRG